RHAQPLFRREGRDPIPSLPCKSLTSARRSEHDLAICVEDLDVDVAPGDDTGRLARRLRGAECELVEAAGRRCRRSPVAARNILRRRDRWGAEAGLPGYPENP